MAHGQQPAISISRVADALDLTSMQVIPQPLRRPRPHGHSRRTVHVWYVSGAAMPRRRMSDDELRGWVQPVRALGEIAEQVHVLMNNCYRDYAVRNASQMAVLLATS
jgi:uncharacterized protein YecE (DUF72 family)